MDATLSDALRRVAALRGTAYVLDFYVDCLILHGRLESAVPELGDDAEAIIREHYAVISEAMGHDYAQRFVRFWLTLSRFIERVDKGVIARRALRRQMARVRRA